MKNVVIKLDDYARFVEERKAELGLTDSDFLTNTGARRSPEKRAMLAAVDDLLRRQGKSLPLKSQY